MDGEFSKLFDKEKESRVLCEKVKVYTKREISLVPIYPNTQS